MLNDESLCQNLVGNHDAKEQQNQRCMNQLHPDALVQDVVTNCQHDRRGNHDHVANGHQLFAVPRNVVGKVAGHPPKVNHRYQLHDANDSEWVLEW